MKQNLPLFLTALRIFVALFLLPFLIVGFLPDATPLVRAVLILFFGLTAFTDFLDGYFARRWKAVSKAGALLDPVADKCLTIAVMFALVWCHLIPYWIAILFTVRDLIVSSLRTAAGQRGVDLPVIQAAKYKTTLLYFYLAASMGTGYIWYYASLLFGVPAVLLSIITMLIYGHSCYLILKQRG